MPDLHFYVELVIIIDIASFIMVYSRKDYFMQNTAQQTIQKYNMIQNGDCIVVGLSGGADSVALFHFLCGIRQQYKLMIIGVHIHHGIRGSEADCDAEYVRQLCSEYNACCEVFYFDIHKQAQKLKCTDEEAGRLIRYKVFDEVLEKYNANKVAVAHNMNDQTETLLMRICRGTGLRGLTGIAAVRGNIIRPLLECSRDSIEQYCHQNQLEYRTDYTNGMDIYTRNKIRLHLIPWIKENLNPAIVQTLSKMGCLLQEEEDYMQLQAKDAYDACVTRNNHQIVLSIESFKRYHSVLQKRVLRLILQNFKKDLQNMEQGHIADLLKLIDKDSGKKINLPYNIVASKQYDHLCFNINDKTKSTAYCYPMQLNEKIEIGQADIYVKAEIKSIEFLKEKRDNLYTKVFDYDKINDNIKIRTRLSGDKIYLKSIGYKKLKDFFIDLKMPRDQRDSVPIIALQDEAIWILGYRTNSKYEVSDTTQKILYIEYGYINKALENNLPASNTYSMTGNAKIMKENYNE